MQPSLFLSLSLIFRGGRVPKAYDHHDYMNIVNEKKEETLELFPPVRQPVPLNEHTFFLSPLSLSLSLTLSFLGGPGCLNVKYSIIGTLSFFGSIEPLFYFSLCHWMFHI